MRSETEIRELKGKIDRLTKFISDYARQSEYQNADMSCASNASDALSWVLGEKSTERYESNNYLNLAKLQEVAEGIERRSGKKP